MAEALEAWIAAHGEAAIWSTFSRQALDDGEQLLRREAVVDCNPGGQGFFARVQGDRRHIYSVDCRIHPLPSPKPITPQCSCPAGGDCGHAVAALLYFLNRQTPVGWVKTTPAIHQWLSELSAAGELDAAEPTHSEVLVYLLDESEAGELVVGLRRARPKRRGGYGRLNPFHGLRRAPEGLIQATDRRLLRLLPEVGSAIPWDDRYAILQALGATGRAHWQTPENPALQQAESASGGLDWQVLADGAQQLRITANAPKKAFPGHPPVWIDPQTGEFGELTLGLAQASVQTLLRAPIIAPEEVPALSERLAAETFPVPRPKAAQRRRMPPVPAIPCLRLTRRPVSPQASRQAVGDPIAELTFDYAEHRVSADTAGEVLAVFEHGELREYPRDQQAEAAAQRQLENAGLQADGAMNRGRWVPDHTGDWRQFVANTLPELEKAGWQITTEADFPWRLAQADLWQADVQPHRQKPDWFTFDLRIEVDGKDYPVLPLLLALIRDNPEAMSPRHLQAIDPQSSLLVDVGEGCLVPFPAHRLVPLLRGLTELYDPAAKLHDGRLTLPLGRANVLDELAQAEGRALHWTGDTDLPRLGRQLNALSTQASAPIPRGLNGELRPYQRAGVGWLQKLADLGLGGVLADDMGLGKTLQVITHLLLEHEQGRASAPSLIVVPRSLLFNWEREFAKFAPGLRVVRWHGAQRHAQGTHLGDYDVVLTTYSLVVRDIQALSHQTWHLLVLDEAQAVKNPRAQAARAVRALHARQRLSLTGTPLENHLGELWAQLDFVAPGLLGTAASFKRLYRRPIEDDRDQIRLNALRERIAPFLLRRTKQAIAQDLPPKTEIPLYAELVGDQRLLYEQLRINQQARVREALATAGRPTHRVLVLDALLKLRQVCCDPRLVPNAPASAQESAKLTLLMDLLDELLAADRRVIVFSQFTRMLALIETALAARSHRWVTLTGETRDREAAVNAFQNADVPIFLVSLKAGGTGLNLTAADTVIHYDPWWNPAVTRQATDRAHRIGQDQPVFVYHLLTRDTVEDRIMALQRDKAELGEQLLGDTPDSQAMNLDATTIEGLFAPLGDEARVASD